MTPLDSLADYDLPADVRARLERVTRESAGEQEFWVAEDGALLHVNDVACRVLGYDLDELLSRTAFDLLPSLTEQEWAARWGALARKGSHVFRVGLRARDGAKILVEATAVCVVGADERHVVVIARDVTEQAAVERELREREARLRTIFDTSQAGIILVDPRGVITFANGRMAEMFGCSLETLIGSSYLEHLHPNQRGTGDERMHKLIAGEVDHVHTERRYLRADGTDFWGYLSGRREEDARGNLVSLVGVISDITDAKESERAVRASEERYRSLVDLAVDAILHGDSSGIITGVNAVASDLTGYPAAEVVGTPIEALFSEAERQRAPLRFDLLRKGMTVRIERELTRRDGSVVPVDMNSRQMPDGSFQTIIRDVSERKRAEAVVRASEEKFASAFRQAPLLMTIRDSAHGRYLEVNETFCRVSGFSRDEVLGRTWQEVGWFPPEEAERFEAEMCSQGRVAELQCRLVAKDARSVPCLVSAETISYDGADRLLSIAQDVTEKVRLQDELIKAQRLESLGVLAGGIAHDFNNILTGILGNLSFARALVGPEHRAAERLTECEKAAVRAGELTRQLLTFARGGAPVKVAVDTRRLVSEALSFALHGSPVKGLPDLPAELWPLDADEGQIGQVLHNLLINAHQAMPAGGVVTVLGSNEELGAGTIPRVAAGRYVRLTVEDTGPGIPQGALDRIFDPYFTTKEGGTGLGLSSVYSIITRHGGAVHVASALGRGTTFTLHLPAAIPEAATREDRAQPGALETGQGRVLVMDDEAMIRDLACQLLEALGYEASSRADGAEAVAACRDALAAGVPFDAVILDLTVPGGMGGREAARRIAEVDPDAVLVVSSGYSNDPIVADFRAHGFAGAVAKPYSIQTLARELLRLLGTRAGHS